MFFNSFCWSTTISKGMDFVVYIWNSMKWNFNRLLWQIRNKKTMELSGVIYRKLFFRKGKIWIDVFLGCREKPFGRLVLSLSQNEIVQNETHRTEMKDAARRAFGGAISDACDFSRGLARPGWRFFGRKGMLANLLHKVLEKRNRKIDPLSIHSTKRLPNGTRLLWCTPKITLPLSWPLPWLWEANLRWEARWFVPKTSFPLP